MPDHAEIAPPLTPDIVRAAVDAAAGGPVDFQETSMAWVFLTPDRVYKMKRPVRRRPFDFTTLAAREDACLAELALNRRLAPDVYLRIAPLVRDQAARLSVDGKGDVVDWLVVMRRLPAERFLDHAISAGTVTPADISAVAARLEAFHAALPPADMEEDALIGRYRTDIADSRVLLDHAPFRDLRSRFTALLDALEQTLDDTPALVVDRLRAGRIVEGHGDLRPQHVWIGPPVIVIDCLEAARDYRLLDPFEEYATLGMECAVSGADWIGPALFGHAAAALGDRPSARLLSFYTTHRATLRARQALAHLLEPAPRTPEKWRPQAERYLTEANRALVTLEYPAAPPASLRS